MPAATALPERGAGFDRERVGADVARLEREGGVEGGLPIGVGLARRAVDEVEVQAVDARVARPPHGPRHVVGVVGATEREQHVRAHRLHAERHPVHPGGAVGAQLLEVDGVGVALDGDLGVARARDGVEDGGESGCVEQRRRAAAEEHAGGVGQGSTLEVADARGDVVVDEVRPVGPRGEVAVVAPRRAERDVHVHPEARRGRPRHVSRPTSSAATNASWGTSTRPICFMRFFPSFWRSRSLRLREMSPP